MNDLESKSQSSVESANLEQKSPTSASRDSFYNTKQIMFQGRPCTICLQNKNGPCPLLSIINVLSLAGKIRMDHRRKISIESMCDAIGNLLLESVNANPGNLEIHSPSNLEKILSDTMSILPKLQVGLDVNVRFDRINGFEYTPELEIFDMLGINLVHGWLVDPQDDEAYAIVSTLSYNQLIELSLNSQDTLEDTQIKSRSSIAQRFLTENSAQLTYHGLSMLYSQLLEGRVAILFRNNHFSVIYKFKGNLYALVTDESFNEFPDIVWEEMIEIDGDTRYLNSDFRIPSMTGKSNHAPANHSQSAHYKAPKNAHSNLHVRSRPPTQSSRPKDDCTVL